MHSIFFDLTIVFILAGVSAFLVSLFKQPSIIAYIITGLIIGPFGYIKISQGQIFEGLGEIGITLLLFMVGLELDLSQLRRLGKAAIIAGTSQILFTTGFSFFIANLLGFSTIASLYIALALTFSSTIITVKLLNEKKDLYSLYGKITTAILILQDFVAIGILIFLSTSGVNTGTSLISLETVQIVTLTITKGLIIGLLVFFHSKYIFPKILRYIGKSEELLLVFSLAWALGFAGLVSLPVIGFNLEVGGFIAGLALAGSSVHYQIAGRIKSLRDFFIILFFITLGAGLSFTGTANHLTEIIIFLILVLLCKPLFTYLALNILGYKSRTSFFTGISIAQVSEFSLILLALGVKLGHIEPNILSLLTIVGFLSIAISSYGTVYSHHLFQILKTPLSWITFGSGQAEKQTLAKPLKDHVVLIGAHRLGQQILHTLKNQNQPFIVIDFNPDIVEDLKNQNTPVIYGDIVDTEIQEASYLTSARLIISTVPNFKDNVMLSTVIKKHHKKIQVILTAHDETEALFLYDKGADYVIVPHLLGGLHIAKLLGKNQDIKDLKTLKQHHLKLLSNSL